MFTIIMGSSSDSIPSLDEHFFQTRKDYESERDILGDFYNSVVEVILQDAKLEREIYDCIVRRLSSMHTIPEYNRRVKQDMIAFTRPLRFVKDEYFLDNLKDKKIVLPSLRRDIWCHSDTIAVIGRGLLKNCWLSFRTMETQKYAVVLEINYCTPKQPQE